MAGSGAFRVRRWREEDIPGLVECHARCYSDFPLPTLYDARIYGMQLAAFPDGQFLVEHAGKVVGYATSIIVQLDEGVLYSYQEITGAATFSTHEPTGDTLYGADIAVDPEFRGRQLAGQLYQRRISLLKRYNLRRMVAYGRLVGYPRHVGTLTPEEYVEKVRNKELSDSALSAHLKAGYQVRRVLFDKMTDQSSLNYSTLLELPNPDYRPAKRRIAAAPLSRPVRKVRVAAAQYMMRPIKGWEEFADTVRFFVNVADEYNCHFLVLPELYCVHLFSTMSADAGQLKMMQQLARMEGKILDLLVGLAKEAGIYLVGGSQPVIRDDKIYNTCPLVTPSGNVYTQDKLHITPSERNYWGIRPGTGIRVFDTPFGRIAIQVCYDIEFPEVSRLLALAGVEVVFVPFSTDDRKAYYRVRYCAQARAVENYFYCVLAGNVGNLPSREYLLNYGKSAILTPSDFHFPPFAIAAEADPNVETVVIGEIDLSSLAELRLTASVRPLLDRRTDLYQLTAPDSVSTVRVE